MAVEVCVPPPPPTHTSFPPSPHTTTTLNLSTSTSERLGSGFIRCMLGRDHTILTRAKSEALRRRIQLWIRHNGRPGARRSTYVLKTRLCTPEDYEDSADAEAPEEVPILAYLRDEEEWYQSSLDPTMSIVERASGWEVWICVTLPRHATRRGKDVFVFRGEYQNLGEQIPAMRRWLALQV